MVKNEGGASPAEATDVFGGWYAIEVAIRDCESRAEELDPSCADDQFTRDLLIGVAERLRSSGSNPAEAAGAALGWAVAQLDAARNSGRSRAALDSVMKSLRSLEGAAQLAGVPAAPPSRGVPQQRAQEEAILGALEARGVDPLKMPKAPMGNKPWPLREEIGDELKLSSVVMKKAFGRLRADGRMKDE
jgi:hypothetical protein